MRENLCIQSFFLRKPSLLTVLLPFMTRCWLGHLKDNMERVVLDDMGRKVSYGGKHAEDIG